MMSMRMCNSVKELEERAERLLDKGWEVFERKERESSGDYVLFRKWSKKKGKWRYISLQLDERPAVKKKPIDLVKKKEMSSDMKRRAIAHELKMEERERYALGPPNDTGELAGQAFVTSEAKVMDAGGGKKGSSIKVNDKGEIVVD